MIAILFLINNRDRAEVLPRAAHFPQMRALLEDRDRFNIYCLLTANENDSSATLDPDFRRRAVVCPTIYDETEYGTWSVAGAMRDLLQFAMDDDMDNNSFVFLSESCVPLYSPDVIHDVLTNHVGGSWFSRWAGDEQIAQRLRRIPGTHERIGISGQQCVMNRDHAAVALFRFDDMAKEIGDHVWGPDEMVFISALLTHQVPPGELVFHAEGPVFTDWERPRNSSPHEFNALTREELFRLLMSDALFCRKVHPESTLQNYSDVFMKRTPVWWYMAHFQKGSAHHVFNTMRLMDNV